MRSLWSAIGIALLTAGLSLPTPAQLPAEPAVRLSATFLQLWADHWNWPAERWLEMFRHFEALGIQEIYVQWSLYDEISYAAPGPRTAGRTPPLATVMRLAAERRMKVHLGLSFQGDFWQQAKPGPHLGAYLAAQRRRSLAIATDCAALYGHHPAFEGWYVAEEIDDLMWPAGEARQHLHLHLRELMQGLRRLTPGRAISISGYAGARSDPARLAAFWQELLAQAPFETVMFQDGIGVGNLPLAYLRQYLEAMASATRQASARLRVIVETFRQVDGTFNGRSFRALPVPLAFLLPQLETAAPYSSGGLVAFSVPEYLTPLGGRDAAESYLAYLDWLRTAGVAALSRLEN